MLRSKLEIGMHKNSSSFENDIDSGVRGTNGLTSHTLEKYNREKDPGISVQATVCRNLAQEVGQKRHGLAM